MNKTIKNCSRQQFDKAGKHPRVVRHSRIPFCESWKIFGKYPWHLQWRQSLTDQISCHVNISAMQIAMAAIWNRDIHAWFLSVFVLGVKKVRLYCWLKVIGTQKWSTHTYLDLPDSLFRIFQLLLQRTHYVFILQIPLLNHLPSAMGLLEMHLKI